MTELAEITDPKTIALERQNQSLVMQEKSFELLQRKAKMLASSKLVPDDFKNNVGDCAIIVEMAERLGLDAFQVARGIYFVHKRPAFYTKFAVGVLHRSGVLHGRLKYRTKGDPATDDYAMQAYGTERISGEEMAGPYVSYKMAKAEGWFTKDGSKWKTMPELMLQYRAASFFINTNCPEILQGVPTVEELQDIKDITPPKENGPRISQFNDDEPEPKKQEYVNKRTGEVIDHE